MKTEEMKFQITCAFQMCEARIENGQEYKPAMDDLENEIMQILDGKILYDESGLTL